MSSERTAGNPTPGPEPDATHRQRFGLVLSVGLGFLAAGISYFGTRDAWVTADRRPDPEAVSTSAVPTDPASDIELPEGPHRDEFQTSCLICHSARLPLGQPPFGREQWAEIVHKMVAVYGAPSTVEEEALVVDYLLAARPPAP
jgi:cytochrome c5